MTDLKKTSDRHRSASSNGGERWAAIRHTVRDAIAPLFAALDEPQRISLRQEFEIELELMFARFRMRIGSAAHSASAELQHDEIVEACRVLNVESPSLGKPIDRRIKKRAHRHYRELVRTYHPDLRGGDESLRPHLDVVVNAWATLERAFAEHEEQSDVDNTK